MWRPILGAMFNSSNALLISATVASLLTYQCETSKVRAPA